MPESQTELTDLAGALADGREVDWAAAAARAPTRRDRAQVEALSLISQIAGAYDAASAFDSAASPTTAPEPRAPGTHWGRLEIVELIGSGTFGHVYRARDARLDRDVALKLLHHVDDRAIADRDAGAIAEGRLLAKVTHPHVVRVLGADRDDGQIGIWMELVEGDTLEAALAEHGPLAAADATSIALDLCRAVSAVHAAGLLHRDIKLQNIIRDRRDGRIVLMDLSAGRTVGDPGRHGPLAQTLAGSPAYLAPEVIDGRGATEKSDVYSLGVVLFRLLSGRFPVEGATLTEVADAHTRGRRARLTDLQGTLPRRLTAVVDRALAPDPDARFATAAAMAQALVDVRGARARRRRWLALGAAAVLALTTLVAATWGWHAWHASRPVIPFAARDWVLVAGVENRSADPAFDDVLGPALIRELAGSGFVNVVPRARIEDTLALMQKPLDLLLDAGQAREVSVRDGGIQALITGRIERVGPAYVLTTDIVHPADGVVRASISDTVTSVETLLATVQQQALRVRQALGETLPAMVPATPGLQRVTTPSLPALRLYTEAAALMDGESWLQAPDLRSRYATAEALLHRATEADPTFASAWLLLAQTVRAQFRTVTEALPLAERAMAEAIRSTPVERSFIAGVVHRFRADAAAGRTDDLEASARAFEAVLQLAPDHYWSLLELGPIYRRLQRHADADRVALHAAEVRPHSIKLGVDAIRALLAKRDKAEVSRRAPALLALVPASALTLDSTAARTCQSSRLGCVGQDATWLRLWKMADAWLDGDAPAALEALREADRQYAGQPGSLWQYQLYFAYQGLGRFGDARQVALRMPDEMRRFFVPQIEARLEDRAAFDRVAGDLRSFEVRDELSYMLIWVGRLGDARRLAEERRRRATGELPTGWREFEGHLRHAEGRHGEAAQILGEIARDATAPRLRMNEVLASARRGTGDVQGAIATLAFTNRKAVAVMPNYTMYDWLRARVLLMELYREAGWVSQADEVEAEVRRLMRVADANHPLFRRLR